MAVIAWEAVSLSWVLVSHVGNVMDGCDVQCSSCECLKEKEGTQLCFPNFFVEMPPQGEI